MRSALLHHLQRTCIASVPLAVPSRDPRTAREALSGDFGPSAQWLEAMRAEVMRIINDFEAFVPVSRIPRGHAGDPIPTTWVLKRKPTRLKARLVATQSLKRYEIDDEFSPAVHHGVTNERIRADSRWQAIRLAFSFSADVGTKVLARDP